MAVCVGVCVGGVRGTYDRQTETERETEDSKLIYQIVN